MSEWVALERIEGPVLGPRRDDLRAGVIAATVANVNRAARSRAAGPEDFVLQFSTPSEEDQSEMLSKTLSQIANKKR